MLRASSRPLVGCMAACSEADLFRHAAGLHCERLLRAEVTNQEFQKKGSEVHPDWKAGPREGGWMWIQLSCTGPACDAAGGSCTRALQTRMDNAYRYYRATLRPGDAETWLSSFWAQVREISKQIVDSLREGQGGRLGMFEILGLDFIRKAKACKRAQKGSKTMKRCGAMAG